MKNVKNYLKEAEEVFTENLAMEESSRCLLCHDAPCSRACPAGSDPAKFIRSLRFRNFEGSVTTLRENNILAETCATVCPYDKYCEGACSRTEIDKPIKIGKIQKFLTHYENLKGLKVIKKPIISKEKVAVIGGGPSGLAASANLAICGYDVTVFEKNEKPGGWLSYGIIPSRLPQEVVDREVQYIKDLGVKFVCNSNIGIDTSIENLKKEDYKAFLISTGIQKAKVADIRGIDFEGVLKGTEFLHKAKSLKGDISIGKSVIVIGGGDVALDCASTAKLLGVADVKILYRRRLEDMPAGKDERNYVGSLDIPIFTGIKPSEIMGKDGKVIGIKAVGNLDDSEITLPCDTVIFAIGQEPCDIDKIANFSKDEKGISKSSNATTDIPGVFVAGDIAQGDKTVVYAVSSGKKAAQEIDEYLTSQRNYGNLNSANIESSKKEVNLSIDFCGVRCENPFFLASSPVANNYDMCAKALESGWGGIAFKTLAFFVSNEVSPRFDTLKKEGTPFLGFKNMEQLTEKPLEVNLEWLKKLKTNYPSKILIASIMGRDEKEWEDIARLVTEAGADIVECNFSCPQMAKKGLGSDIGQNPELVKELTAAVRRGTHLPILAKMTPNVGHMEIPARAAIEGGATGISAINTIKCITNIDLDKFVGIPTVNAKSSISGYSGKAVKPIALRFVAQLKQDPMLKDIPLSGIGGIETWEDAAEFILLGATNLQVTTAIMQYGYRIVEDLKDGLSRYISNKGFSSLKEMIGMALPNTIPAEELDRSFVIYPKINNEKCVGCGRCYISCFDGAHQALEWNTENRRVELLKDKCVGCHLCINVCPVGCIEPGERINK
jgi:dihydropyrimidine dehydrogenase (NAD+) subunit PreA